MTVESRLKDAIGTGELVNIIYHGGSEPGASRQILPLALKEDKVRAKCYKTLRVKEFWLDKIELASNDVINYTGTKKIADYDEIAGIMTLDDVLARCEHDLTVPGFILYHDDNGIFLFKIGKSGKPLKTPVSVLMRVDGYQQKKWLASGGSYKYLSKAADQFIEHAKLQIKLDSRKK